jgi:simple sugar transport system permease protein
MKEPPGNFPQTPAVELSAQLPRILPGTRLHLGLIVALLAIVLFYIFLWKTTVGYETRVVGQNIDAARYAGINPERNAYLAMFIAGGFGGMAGMNEILGIQQRLFQAFSPGYGFDGIAVALLGQNTPIGILLSGILFGILRSGANMMQMAAKVPIAVIYIIQALVIMFVVGSSIFTMLQKRRSLAAAAKGGNVQ